VLAYSVMADQRSFRRPLIPVRLAFHRGVQFHALLVEQMARVED
jgi:hypothetical protein